MEPPAWWDEGEEPDYRFSLANERTFLAWIRTALALIGGAVAIHGLAADLETSGTATAIAIASAALGATLAGAAYGRWARVQRAMRNRQAIPHPQALRIVAMITMTSGLGWLIMVATS